MSEAITPAAKPAPKPKTLIDVLQSDALKEQFALALPRHLTPDRFARVALTAMRRTPKLQQCTQESVLKCLMDLSAMGLEPDGRRAHLIPYKDECTLIIDYKGLVELIRRSGDVVSIRAETVCAKDTFAWKNGEITHEVNWREDRGKMDCVYAEAVLKGGEKQTAVMTLAEVKEIQKRSRAGTSGPWVTDFGEMAKKTVVRRLSKMLPLASEVQEHISTDDDSQFDRLKNITPAARAVPLDPFSAPALPEPEPAAETPAQPAPEAKDLEVTVEPPAKETPAQELRRRVKEAQLDPKKVDAYLSNAMMPALADITDGEAAEVLATGEVLLKNAK